MSQGSAERMVVTAVGPDRPGMVAALTGALAGLAANLEDTAMTRLAGQFAMMLVVDAGPMTADQVAAALEPPARALGMSVAVVAAAGASGPGDAGPPEPGRWQLSIHGADQPGIVHQVTTLLAGLGANVVDLRSRLVGGPEAPVYVVVLDFETTVAEGGLREQLGRPEATLGCHWWLAPAAGDQL